MGSEESRNEAERSGRKTDAVNLYEKCGFKIEGTREKPMKGDGVFADEYYVAKVFL